MEHTTHSPRRLFFVGLVAIIALIAVVALIAYLFAGSDTHKNTAISTDESSISRVASAETVRQNISDLEASLKQSATDQAAISAAMKDKPVKVGS